MVKTSLLMLLSLAVGVLMFGTAEANTDLTYAYYAVQDASNYMAVNVTTTANCIVKPAKEEKSEVFDIVEESAIPEGEEGTALPVYS